MQLIPFFSLLPLASASFPTDLLFRARQTIFTTITTVTTTAQTPLVTSPPSLDQNSACDLIGTALYICESLTPSFTALDPTDQALCLCYSRTSWVPNVFDNAMATCINYAKSVADESYTAIANLDGFCNSVGDIYRSGRLDGGKTTTSAVGSIKSIMATVTGRASGDSTETGRGGLSNGESTSAGSSTTTGPFMSLPTSTLSSIINSQLSSGPSSTKPITTYASFSTPTSVELKTSSSFDTSRVAGASTDTLTALPTSVVITVLTSTVSPTPAAAGSSSSITTIFTRIVSSAAPSSSSSTNIGSSTPITSTSFGFSASGTPKVTTLETSLGMTTEHKSSSSSSLSRSSTQSIVEPTSLTSNNSHHDKVIWHTYDVYILSFLLSLAMMILILFIAFIKKHFCCSLGTRNWVPSPSPNFRWAGKGKTWRGKPGTWMRIRGEKGGSLGSFADTEIEVLEPKGPMMIEYHDDLPSRI